MFPQRVKAPLLSAQPCPLSCHFFQSSYNRFDIVDSDPDMAIDGFYADLEPLLQLAYNSIDGISADTSQCHSCEHYFLFVARLINICEIRTVKHSEQCYMGSKYNSTQYTENKKYQ